MTKQKLLTTIAREIRTLNKSIDLKILRGEPYRREAERHRRLYAQLTTLKRQYSLFRSLGFLSFF